MTDYAKLEEKIEQLEKKLEEQGSDIKEILQIFNNNPAIGRDGLVSTVDKHGRRLYSVEEWQKMAENKDTNKTKRITAIVLVLTAVTTIVVQLIKSFF